MKVQSLMIFTMYARSLSTTHSRTQVELAEICSWLVDQSKIVCKQ